MRTGRSIKLGILAGLAVAALSSAAVSEETTVVRPAYVGAERCRMCHLAQYKTWQATPMASAWERIKEAPDRERCLPCHTTGFGEPGGYVASDTTPKLQGVQCEACHGPGGAHVALPVTNRDTATRRSTINRFQTDCRSCHNPHVPNKAEAARARASATN